MKQPTCWKIITYSFVGLFYPHMWKIQICIKADRTVQKLNALVSHTIVLAEAQMMMNIIRHRILTMHNIIIRTVAVCIAYSYLGVSGMVGVRFYLLGSSSCSHFPMFRFIFILTIQIGQS